MSLVSSGSSILGNGALCSNWMVYEGRSVQMYSSSQWATPCIHHLMLRMSLGPLTGHVGSEVNSYVDLNSILIKHQPLLCGES